MPQTKEEKNEYQRLYREKNKEKKKETDRLYKLKNKKELNEKSRIYQISFRLKNKEEIKEINKLYSKTPTGIKTRRISKWKNSRVLDHYEDNFETLYRIYLSTKFCDNCGFELNTGDERFRKVLDHCHTSEYFRNILCHSCNVRRG